MQKTWKNRNKNLRNITVNGVGYKWAINNYNCDGDWGYNVRIWDSNGNILYDEIHHDRSIKPKTISEIIKRRNQ